MSLSLPVRSRSWWPLCPPHCIGRVIAGIAVSLFVVLFVLQADRPLNLDNMDFPAAAAATAQTGLPVYYRGEWPAGSPDTPPVYYAGKERHGRIALYHPPLYVYTLAAWMRIMGTSASSARILNLLCAIAAGLIALLTLGDLFGRDLARRAMPVFAIVYLLNPFALQGFSILDIDTSIYPPLICLVIWASVRLVVCNGNVRTTPVAAHEYGFLGLVVMLCIWSKLTTALALPLIIGPMLSLRLGLIRSALYCSILFALAGLGFWTTYALYGWITGLDVGYTWAFLGASVSTKAPLVSDGQGLFHFYLLRFAANLSALARWGLFPAIVGAMVAGAAATAHSLRNCSHKRLPWLGAVFILLFGFFVLVIYCLITAVFSGEPFKYVVPVWPTIAMAYAGLIIGIIRPLDQSDVRLFTSVSVAIAAGLLIGLFLLRDGIILQRRGIPWGAFGLGLAIALTSLVAIEANRLYRAPAVAARHFILIGIAAFAAQSLGVAVFQVRTDHATQYDYGEVGFDRVCEWIKTHTSPGDVIMSMKDVGFATDRPYLESYQYVVGPASLIPELQAAVIRLKIHVFVATDRFGQDNLYANPALHAWLDQNTHPVFRSGDYFVFYLNQ